MHFFRAAQGQRVLIQLIYGYMQNMQHVRISDLTRSQPNTGSVTIRRVNAQSLTGVPVCIPVATVRKRTPIFFFRDLSLIGQTPVRRALDPGSPAEQGEYKIWGLFLSSFSHAQETVASCAQAAAQAPWDSLGQTKANKWRNPQGRRPANRVQHGGRSCTTVPLLPSQVLRVPDCGGTDGPVPRFFWLCACVDRAHASGRERAPASAGKKKLESQIISRVYLGVGV